MQDFKGRLEHYELYEGHTMRATMRRIIIIFVAAILGIVVPDGTRSQDVPPAPPSEYDKELVKQIQKGDNDAIEKAGKSGNRILVPYRRQEKDKLQQPRLQPQKEKERLQQGYPVRPINPAALALARLGETQELQEVWCKAITDEPKRGLVPSVNELEQVGGWFAIEGLQALLTPEGLIHWHKPTRQEKNSDTSDLPVEVRAMFALS